MTNQFGEHLKPDWPVSDSVAIGGHHRHRHRQHQHRPGHTKATATAAATTTHSGQVGQESSMHGAANNEHPPFIKWL